MEIYEVFKLICIVQTIGKVLFDYVFLFLYVLTSLPLSSTSLRVNTLSCVVTRLCQCFDKFFKGLISLHKSEFGLFYDVLSKLWESTIRLEALI